MTHVPETLALQAAHLHLDHVTKRFGNHPPAVDGVTLEIPRGSFATLLGPSGCGKTTLLRTIAGFYEPDGGTILLDQQRIDHMPVHRRGTAMVFQDYALFPHMTVFDNVAYGLRLAKLPSMEVTSRARETLEFVGLTGFGERWPNQLSGGQQQRVALARALVVRPKVLLLDEPLSNLDANLRERMRWELRALQQQLGITFLYVTHDQAEALAMSDWIAVMNSGHVEQWGAPWEMYYRPRTAFMAEFIGAANLKKATVQQRSNGQLVVQLGSHTLTVPTPENPVGDNVLLCIRPESIRLNPSGETSKLVCLAGTVTRRAFLGYHMRYWITVDGDEWVVDLSDPGMFAQVPEGAVQLGLDPARIHVIEDK